MLVRVLLPDVIHKYNNKYNNNVVILQSEPDCICADKDCIVVAVVLVSYMTGHWGVVCCPALLGKYVWGAFSNYICKYLELCISDILRFDSPCFCVAGSV